MARVDVHPTTTITLTVRLLGRMSVQIDDRPVRIAGRQPQALFALLVLRPRSRTREAIAADLWPDAATGSTGSLRQALWLVRSALASAGTDPDRVIESDTDSIGLRSDVTVEHDVAEFERLVRGRPARPEEALRVYRGELAEGFAHECFARDRENLADAFEDALAMAAGSRLALGDLDGARSAALELLARDPLREEAHQALLWVYGASGSRSQVLRQFRRLEALLAGEIGEAPLPETIAAFRAAMAASVVRSRRRAAAASFRRDPGLVFAVSS
jgi:DNA-binding SARP family transcriptional activator